MAKFHLPEYLCERDQLQRDVSTPHCPLTPSDAERFSSVEGSGIVRLEGPETLEEA